MQIRAIGVLVGALALCGTACDTIECGAGTHQEGDECVPNAPVNCTGEHVVFRDGRCQPRNTVCSDGSSFDDDLGQCVDREPVEPVDTGNNGDPPDMGGDTPGDTGDVPADLDVSDVDMGMDVPPDVPEIPMCEESSADGTICISGVVLDWTRGTPVDTEEVLGVLIDDQTLRGAVPDKQPFGFAPTGPGSSYVLASVPIVQNEEALADMILITGALPDAEETAWFRTLTGVIEPPVLRPPPVESGRSYRGVATYVVPAALVPLWAQLASAEGLGTTRGFMLARVLELTGDELAPVSGATVSGVGDDFDIRYLSDDYQSFRDDTGATGAVLVIGPVGRVALGNFTATATGRGFAPTAGGAVPGVAVITAIIGQVE
jgi:hypothetical protein